MRHLKMFRIALVAFILVGLLSEAKAAYWDWKGKSEGVSYFDDKNCWGKYGNGSTTLDKSNHWIGYGEATIAAGWDNTITSTNMFQLNLNSNINIKYTPAVIFESENNDPNFGINSLSPLTVANTGDGAVEFRSGTYKFSSATVALTSGCSGSIKITDATFITGAFTGGSGTGLLEIDGGIIKAINDNASFMPANNNLTVSIGENGAIIDNDGKNITIAEDITGSGVVTLKGAGKTVFGAGAIIESPLVVDDEQTTIVFEGGTEQVKIKSLELPAGATFEIDVSKAIATPLLDAETLILPAEGKVTLKITGTDVETGCVQLFKIDNIVGDFSNVEVVSEAVAAEGKEFSYSVKSGNVYAHACGADEAVWTGSGDGINFSDANNWSGVAIPSANAKLFFNAVEPNAVLNCDIDEFTSSNITFMEGVSSFRIEGKSISGVTVVSNISANAVELGNSINFANLIDVVQNPGMIKFSGGATGVKLARAMNIHGVYNLTTTADHTELANTIVKSDGVYKILDGTFYKHNGDFSLEQGSLVEVKNAKISRQSPAYLLNLLDGEFVVTNEFLVSGDPSKTGDSEHFVCKSGTGSLILNKLRINQGCRLVLPTAPAKTVLGRDGIIRGSGYVRVPNVGGLEVGSFADWAMYFENLGNINTANYIFYKHNSPETWSDLVFDTTDWYDSNIGRTITCEAPICAANIDSAAKFRVTVKGKGTFLFANKSDDSTNGKWFTGGLIVTNSATVAVNPGCRPGKGVITVHKGASLKVPQSDTVSLDNELNFNDGAILGFHFTKADTMPMLNVDPEKVNFAEGSSKVLYVKITADDGVVPGKGDKVLTSGGAFKGVKVIRTRDSSNWAGRVEVNEEGNLVLKDKVYFYISIR